MSNHASKPNRLVQSNKMNTSDSVTIKISRNLDLPITACLLSRTRQESRIRHLCWVSSLCPATFDQYPCHPWLRNSDLGEWCAPAGCCCC